MQFSVSMPAQQKCSSIVEYFLFPSGTSTGIFTELFALYRLTATLAPCLRLYARLTKTGRNMTPPKVTFVCFHFVIPRASTDIQATLHPHALLPDRQSLVIAQDRTLYRQGEAAQPTSSITCSERSFRLRQASPLSSHYSRQCALQVGPVHARSPPLVPVRRGLHSRCPIWLPQYFSCLRHIAVIGIVRFPSRATTRLKLFLQSSLVARWFSALGHPLRPNSPSGTMEDSSEPPGEDLDAVEPPETPDADGLTGVSTGCSSKGKGYTP